MQQFLTRRLAMLLITAILAMALAACQSAGTKESKGAGLGAAIGFVVGYAASDDNKSGNAVLGLLVGSMIGSKIGKSMDNRDRAKQRNALEKNRTNQPTAWTNPDTGNRYRVTPKRTYRSANKAPCREYETEAYVRGERQVYRGRACRDANGNWTEVRGRS